MLSTMSTSKDFVAWALSPERTLYERCAIEQVMERGVGCWRSQHKLPPLQNWKGDFDRYNARRLNPAYEPCLESTALRQAFEGLSTQTIGSFGSGSDRPLRDLAWLRFFPQFEEVHLDNCEIEDYTPLTALPRLTKLHLHDEQVLDLRVLGRCAGLEELHVRLRQPWVKVEGLERLERLRILQWLASPHSLQGIPCLPSVQVAIFRQSLSDFPLRDVRQLPEMPALEVLELESVFSLEGLGRYARLVNLKVAGSFRSLAPLVECRELTHLWLELPIHLPLDRLQDFRPLLALPELRYLQVRSQRPRDYSFLIEAAKLHEVSLMTHLRQPVEACAMELATLNGALEPWDAEFLAPEPRPLAPLKVHLLDWQREANLAKRPTELEPPSWETNHGYRESEGQWLQKRLSTRLGNLLDDEHWGSVSFSYCFLCPDRGLQVTIQSQEAAERLREVIETIRAELASLRCRWSVTLTISLELPPVLDPRQLAEIERRRDQRDEEDFERRRQEEADYLERQHRLELLKEAGTRIRPNEFAAPATPAEDEEETGDTGEANPVNPLATLFESDRPHPLADQYSLYGTVHEGGAFFSEHRRSTVEWLLGRQG